MEPAFAHGAERLRAVHKMLRYQTSDVRPADKGMKGGREGIGGGGSGMEEEGRKGQRRYGRAGTGDSWVAWQFATGHDGRRLYLSPRRDSDPLPWLHRRRCESQLPPSLCASSQLLRRPHSSAALLNLRSIPGIFQRRTSPSFHRARIASICHGLDTSIKTAPASPSESNMLHFLVLPTDICITYHLLRPASPGSP